LSTITSLTTTDLSFQEESQDQLKLSSLLLNGINIVGQYFQIDIPSKSMFVANLNGAFGSPDWNTDVVSSFENLDLFDDVTGYIRYYTGNTEVGTINYGQNSGVDYAYTGISFNSGISWKSSGVAACNIGRSILFGNTNQTTGHETDTVQIMRPTNPYLLVEAWTLKDPKNLISFSLGDAEMKSPISTSTLFRKVDTIFDGGIDIEDGFGDISIKGGTSDIVNMLNKEIMVGNAIEVAVSSKSGVVRGKGHIGTMIDYTWSPNHDHDDVETYAFSGDRAAIQTNSGNGKVFFYNCRKTAMEKRTCTQFASVPLREPAQPIRRFSSFGDLASAWTCDSKGCYVIFALADGDVSIVDVSKDTVDVYVSKDPKSDFNIRVVVSDGSAVTFWRGPLHEPDALSKYYTLEQSNSGQTWFCPTVVYHCPFNTNVFEVMNDCEGYNQRILKFWIGETRPAFIEDVNVDSLSNAPFFCPMGDEFIVGSTRTLKGIKTYSFTTHDSLNYFSYPENLLGTRWTYDCLSSASRFVTYGFQSDGSVTATVMLGNRGAQQLTRFPVVIPGIHAVQASAFTVSQGTLHWFNTGSGSVFVLTYDAPWIELTASAVEKDTVVDVDFSFTNPGGDNQIITKKVTVTA